MLSFAHKDDSLYSVDSGNETERRMISKHKRAERKAG